MPGVAVLLQQVPSSVVDSDSSAQSTVEGLAAFEVDNDGGADIPGLQEVAVVLSRIDAFQSGSRLVLSCDASAYGVGAVLAHRLPDGTE